MLSKGHSPSCPYGDGNGRWHTGIPKGNCFLPWLI